MKYIKLFLASSIVEFEHERNELGNYILSLNNYYVKHGIYLELVMCEDLSNAMAKASKQEEYNQFIGESDFFYIIFGRSAGQYTIEEFNVALEHFRNTKSPRIYTFFQKLPEGEKAASSVKDFMTRLSEELGHYFSTFSSLDSIKLNMLVEITRSKLLNEKIDIKDGKALINGREMLSLENIPIFKNNTKLQKLQEEISALRKERAELAVKFAENPEDMELYQKLTEVTDRSREITKQLHQLEKTILDICSTIAERNSSGKLVTVWEKEASRCLDEGNYEGALAILRDPAIDEELEHLDKMMDAREEQFEALIKAKRFRIRTLMARGVNQETLPEIYDCYEKCEKVAKKRKIETDIIYEYAFFLKEQKDYENALNKAKWLLKYMDLEREDYGKGVLYGLLGELLQNLHQPFAEVENAFKKEIAIFEWLSKVGWLSKENPAAYESALAKSYEDIANFYSQIYRFVEAEEYYKKAIAIFERLAEENPAAYENDFARIYNNLAALYDNEDVNRIAEAEEYYKKAITFSERLVKDNPGTYEEGGLALTYKNFGELCSNKNRYAEAEEYYKKAIKTYERSVNKNPAFLESGLASSYLSMAGLYYRLNRCVEAEDNCKKAIQALERIQSNANYNSEILLVSYKEGQINSRSTVDHSYGKIAREEGVYEKSIEIFERLAKENPAAYESRLATSYITTADYYSAIFENEGAEELYRKAIEILERLAKENPAAYESRLALCYYNLCERFVWVSESEECGILYRKASEIYERLAKGNPAAYEKRLALCYYQLARRYSNIPLSEEADELYRKAIEIYERLAKENPAVYESRLALCYRDLGKFYDRNSLYPLFEDTEELYRKAIVIFERLAKEDPAYESGLGECYRDLGELYDHNNRSEKALDAYKQADKYKK